MSTIAHSHRFVVGVDTHAQHHVYAITTNLGEILDTKRFPTSSAGINRALSWVARRTEESPDTLWVIEGAASYGALLTATVTTAGFAVAEAPQLGRHLTAGTGKTDVLDAQRIAVATLPIDQTRLRIPRSHDGIRAALRVLITARDEMTTERTRYNNALIALLRTHDLGIDARRAVSNAQIRQVVRWRQRNEPLAVATARAEAVRLATRIIDLDDQLAGNKDQLTELIMVSEAAPLMAQTGFGPVATAVCLIAWSHHGRIRSEAAFASLAGVNPIPASSGNTVRHRLNRGGDRRLNRALHMVAVNRMTYDPETRDYVAKRQAEGRTNKEIRRCVKRYLARRVFRTLNAAHAAEVVPMAA